MQTLIIGFILLSIISGWFVLWKVPGIPKHSKNKQINKKISVIIPARNEERNLPMLLKSLTGQTLQPVEVLVVDDDSEDDTAEVAASFGTRVLQYDSKEVGWQGKSAACFVGAQAAKGEYLLFLDADVFLPSEESLRAILLEFKRQDFKGALSIQPYHVIQSLYENFSVLFNIIVLAGMNRFSILKERLKPAGAFGPSLLIDRNLYFEMGGHELVKDSIMENIDLGSAMLKQHIPIHLYSGYECLHFRMYPDGIKSLSEGWTKSFAQASTSTHPLILIGISLWISGAFISFGFFVWGMVSGNFTTLLLSILGYVLYYLQFYRMANLAGKFSGGLLIFYPLFFFYFVGLFAWSAIKTFVFRTVSWKGRSIDV
ncbi:MAG TPA: glycosyltransferase [Flavobacteriaceae bacterium]|nr:glycosyltransferase [Flavobacteriaceae bacterium]